MYSTIWSDKINEFEAMIRSGRLAEARGRLNGLRIAQVPSTHRARLAQLLTRANLSHKAVACLVRSVRLGNSVNPRASLSNLLTYAFALIRIGSAHEAKQILEALPESCAQKHLYLGFVHQTIWDYALAVPHLEKYLSFEALTPYERATAEVNLAASLIQVRELDRASQMLIHLLPKAKDNNWDLLYRNVSELTAQAAAEQGRWSDARKALASIHSGQSRVQTTADLFVAKWAAFVDVLEKPTQDRVVALRRVRECAKTFDHWETIRDCDRVLAEVTHDVGLFNHVYFGTPFASFRKRMLENSRSWTTPPTSYTLGSQTGPVFDLMAGALKDGTAALRPGHILHRSLCFLLEDFYRPVSMGRLFNQLFPGEYFNPESSPGRVANLIHRTRDWFRNQGLPLEIETSMRSFQVKLTDPNFGIYFSKVMDPQVTQEINIEGYLTRIRSRLDTAHFTCGDAFKTWDVSRSAAIRILNGAVNAGLIARLGKGRNTYYQWTTK
ncbi:MAG: hypothetical protein AB7F86_09465 [Bdellovibrionales bacterium]